MALQPSALNAFRLNASRLNYLTGDMVAARPTRVRIVLNGVESRTRVRVGSLSITDALNDTPNTCTFTIQGSPAPTVAVSVQIWLNSNAPILIFGGAIQTVEQSYEGAYPPLVVYRCTGIDDGARANRRLPFGAWANISVTTIAQQIIATFAPGFSSSAVQVGLPAATVNLDGSEGMDGAIKQLAKLIGGYYYFDNLTLHLYQTEAGTPPDPIDAAHPPLDDPPIRLASDQSQVRTRVYGKGHGESVITDVLPSDTLLPISNVVMFNPSGGRGITLTQRFTYTGTVVGGGGSLVGPGVTAAAPTLRVVPGGSIPSGVHQYMITFYTAAGETIPGQGNTITVGYTPSPSPAMTSSVDAFGGSVDWGVHQYALTYTTSVGETVPGPLTPATSYGAPLPVPGPIGNMNNYENVGTLPPGVHAYAITYLDAYGETTPGPSLALSLSPPYTALTLHGIPVGPGGTANKSLYRDDGAGLRYLVTIPNSTTDFADTGSITLGGPAPSTNTTKSGQQYKRVVLSQIPLGDASVTARKLYRTKADQSALLFLATIPVGTSSYVDTAADTALGAAAPTSSTATANGVVVGLPIGQTLTLGRKIYRSVAGTTSPLKLVATVADNTSTTYTDTIADASLGAAPPSSDTSNLSQPTGEVPGGSSVVPLASALPFDPAGGWVVLGAQVIRYTGVSGNTLTGLPATGPGALVNTIRYGEHADRASVLTGVAGLVQQVAKGDPINLWVQIDDPSAQASMAALDGGDGIYEHLITDERRGEQSLRDLCTADLNLYSRPIQTLTYATRDTKTRSGQTVTVNLPTIGLSTTVMIQTVQIGDIDLRPGLNPTYSVTASSVRVSLEDLLRQLADAAAATGSL